MTTHNESTIEIYQEADPKTSVQLDPIQGEQIRSLIVQNSDLPFTRYVERMGLQPTNVANYLSGRNRITIQTLTKLLAGIDHQLQCLLHVQISTGRNVETVDSIPLEEMLLLHEPGTSIEESTSTDHPELHTSSLSGQPLKEQTTIPAKHFKETQDESSISFSSLQPLTSDTPSPTSSDADQQPKTLEGT